MRGFPLFTMFLVLGLAAVTWQVYCRLAYIHFLDPDKARSAVVARLRWLTEWTIKALVIPMVLWAVMNLEWSFELQPFMPEIQRAIASGPNWLPVYFRFLGSGWLMLVCVWGAFTLAWAIGEIWRTLAAEQRKQALALSRSLLLFLAIPVALWVYFGGWMRSVFACLVVFGAFAAALGNVLRPLTVQPSYSRAVARIKFGKYAQAETEILKELERRESDFNGWLMLAELYAERFNDLPEAERTVLQLSQDPEITLSQRAVALHKLADWHLKLERDPEGARRALQRICDQMPGSHLAKMAHLRLSHIPETRQAYLESLEHKPVRLPPGKREPLT